MKPVWGFACGVLLALSLHAHGEAKRETSPAANQQALVALARLYGAVRYFYPGDAVVRVPWDRFLIEAAGKTAHVKDEAEIGPLMKRQFESVVPQLEIQRHPFDAVSASSQPPPPYIVEWRHYGLGIGQQTPSRTYRSFRVNRDEADDASSRLAADWPRHATFELVAGWHARFPTALASDAALIGKAQDRQLNEAAAGLPRWDTQRPEVTRDQSLAAGIALWSIAHQFYPYWADVEVNWEDALLEFAGRVPEKQTRKSLRDSLRRLAARLADGHAGVNDMASQDRRGLLPMKVRPVGDRFVVTAASAGTGLAPGDEIVSMNGRDIKDVMRELRETTSSGAHARDWLAAMNLESGELGAKAKLGLRRGNEGLEAELAYGSQILAEKRPEAITELEPGIHYVDLSRFDAGSFQEALAVLSKGTAIIFDMRGYPTGAATAVVPYWMTRKEEIKWMQVPIRTRPFVAPEDSRPLGWSISPRAELANVRKILLTDPRAISYSESLTGYFAAYAQGTIVGEPTAGANGNVSAHELPGGYHFRFTGMLVTAHDGKTRIHARGFQPDVLTVPTIEGIRAGRDEVLERAIQIARGRT